MHPMRPGQEADLPLVICHRASRRSSGRGPHRQLSFRPWPVSVPFPAPARQTVHAVLPHTAYRRSSPAAKVAAYERWHAEQPPYVPTPAEQAQQQGGGFHCSTTGKTRRTAPCGITGLYPHAHRRNYRTATQPEPPCTGPGQRKQWPRTAQTFNTARLPYPVTAKPDHRGDRLGHRRNTDTLGTS